MLKLLVEKLFLQKRKNCIKNMNEAYERSASFKEGYGVFIFDISKTEDIEQSLVFGAQ
jgi:hypothetical protein